MASPAALDLPDADAVLNDPTRQAGIHAIEMYVPRHAVAAATLERAHGVDGKYTSGLMMTEFCGTGEDEDPVSIGLTVLARLMHRHGVRFEDVGMLYVGSESHFDRAKSIASTLMMLFNEHGCDDIEGVDTYNACYGGTAALLNCVNWLQSDAWDGRWAIAIATDVADAPAGYRFMTGCSSVAMLVGVDAALVLERERASHMLDRWDFYKPWGWHEMAPVVDAPGSIDVYYECLDACQQQLLEKRGLPNIIESADYCVFHLGSGPKFVKHAFERCVANAYGFDEPPGGARTKSYDGVLSPERLMRLFEEKVAPTLRLATRIGPQHTAATYTALTSLLVHAAARGGLVGKTINVFSYGSGAAATMFRLRVARVPGYVADIDDVLDRRHYIDAASFDQIMDEYAETYARFDWTARVRNGPQPPGAYYLRGVDAYGRRSYYMVREAAEGGLWHRLPPPYLSEPPPHETADDVERARASLPEAYRDLPELTHVSGVQAPFPPKLPREVADAEMIEHGLMRPGSGPVSTDAATNAAAAPSSVEEVAESVAELLQLMGRDSSSPESHRPA